MEPWDAELIRRQTVGTLVHLARQGRVLLDDLSGPRRVDLSWVDEAALALVDSALDKNERVNLVYPAPAGEVSVLLAAQILVHKLIAKRPSPSVGLLTDDPGAAVRRWNEIRIGRGNSRVPIHTVFPVFRAAANGLAQLGDHPFQGLLVGRRCARWPVDVTVVDELAGPVLGEPRGTVIRVFADPLDPRLEEAASRGELIWGWSEGTLSLWNEDLEHATPNALPFSVAHERLKVIASGIDLTVCVCRNASAEAALRRLREDLALLARHAGPHPARHLELALRVAWSHTATLSALPCEPSWYDKFAGMPPRAARSTATFERELSAWASTLDGPTREYGSIVASDIADLRAALEKGNPFLAVLKQAAAGSTRTLAILRTKTAARALLSRLDADPNGESAGSLTVCWMGALHRLSSWDSAIVTGSPSRSAWHRIDSGISKDVRLLVLGDDEARRARSAIGVVKQARERWGSLEFRERTWRRLIDRTPPPAPLHVPYEPPHVPTVSGPTAGAHDVDPFSPLGALLTDERPLLLEEGSDEFVARPTADDQWSATVKAVEVLTDLGKLVLAEDEEVDVLEDEPATYVASDLQPGMRIVVGRQSGRLGLIEALEDKLKHRPDLLAARTLVKDYQTTIYSAFAASGLSFARLYAAMRARGCNKHEFTVENWVTAGGPMAPRDRADLEALVEVLDLKYSATRVREVFASVERIRTFRRVAGRALARAASEAVLRPEDAKVDPATGLSLADLRDAVAIATIRSIRRLDAPVRLAETGRLEESST